ncbi:phosphatase PAP2 family protein [Pedobacter suwonensis]|uniref:phosphatase PAP2 family protein n=1 Tax=Pedobacter suwonensis TaxID=332999 RepID=UPI00367B152C
MKNSLFIFFLIFLSTGLAINTKAQRPADSLTDIGMRDPESFRIKMRTTEIVATSASIAYGAIKLGNHGLTDVDIAARQEFALEHPHPKFRVDDYLQFAPGGVTLIMGAAGIEGRNRFGDQAGVYLLSNLILNITTQSIKRITKVPRPDGSSNAFPSGHTAEAFASAEFMSLEYGRRSIAYPIGAYASAVAVGYLRMYNNKHWLSDVVTGAGVGFLSTRLAYLIYPAVKQLFWKKGTKNAMALPSYNHGMVGASLIGNF